MVAALNAEEPILRASLAQTPQPNETGRAALLPAALSRLDPELPVRLCEIGTSAGLNLRADHRLGLEAGPLGPIRDRVGCDIHPIDPGTAAGRLALSSYVWVDDVARFERLRRALRVAELVPATVVTADAADFAAERGLEDGTTTVLWHSAFWLYLHERTRERIIAAISALGASATPTRRFAHAKWEWARQPESSHPEFVLVLQSWSGSAGDSHGNSVALVSD